MIRVLIADDQTLVRQAFSVMLGVEDDFELVGQCANGEEALAQATSGVDVVLMDIEMPVMNGIEATRRIRAVPDAPEVIIVTTFDRDDYLFDALRAGAAGFMLKNADPEELVRSIRTVVTGSALLAPEVTRRVIEQALGALPVGAQHPGLARLTGREQEILTLMAQGWSNAEIAERAFVSETTVKTHVSSILTKLQVRDRVQAVIIAIHSGLARESPPQEGDAATRFPHPD